MTKRPTVDLEAEIARYVSAASRHHVESDAGHLAAANAAQRELVAAWDRIRAAPGEWTKPFLALLDHGTPGVRVWAAAHSLAIDPERAVAVLELLVAEPKTVGADAVATLKAWREGTLHFTS